MAVETLVETVRVVLQCPISHSHEEGVIMDVVEFLLAARREKHSVWGHFHSAPWPPAFFAPYAESNENPSRLRQGLVVFMIDCRSIDHGRSLLKNLRTHLRTIYGAVGRSEANFSVFIHKGERRDSSA